MSVPFMRRIAPFSPTQVSGCQLWLDAADPATISFSSGTSVSQWNDKSGAFLTPSGSLYCPNVNGATVNVVNFTGITKTPTLNYCLSAYTNKS